MATSFRIVPTRENVPQVIHGEEASAQPVVHVVIVVGDVICQRSDLSLQAGMGVELQVVPGRVGLDVAGGRIRQSRAIVLRHPFQGLPGQVQAVEVVVALLQRGQDAHGLRVVIESAVSGHRPVQSGLAGMAEWGVPEIVSQRERLGEVFVHAEDAADRARDLRHLQAVCEARAVVIPLVIDEDLGLVLKPTERRAVDDSIAVALKGGPRTALRLLMETPAAPLRERGIGRCPELQGRRCHT